MRTTRIHWTAYFWPGLPQLWVRGSWAGLAVAVGFTVLLNALLLSTFVFHEWLAREVSLTGYGLLAIVWLAGWWQGRADRKRRFDRTSVDGAEAEDEPIDEKQAAIEQQRDQWFREAQEHYLQGDWVATEQLLLKLLKQDARDVESRLMLATLWRHQGRGEEVLRQLDRLERLEAAEHWQFEIAAEREAVKKSNEAHTEHEIKITTETLEYPPDDTNRRLAA